MSDMDPIKPFTALIRSLRRSVKGAGTDHTAQSATSTTAAAGIATAAPLPGGLQPRLAKLTPWDERRARELFVESTLLHEFGAELAQDPAFFELVQRVSLHLGSESVVNERLDQLLREVAAGRAAR